MAKLGYTFYPKDWGNSESVFELKLHERGLYRELMDLAYLNDNKTEIKKDTWVRKFGCTIDELDSILNRLFELKLIEYKKDLIFIPSCESRLSLSRGGKSSKPTEAAKNNLKNFDKTEKKELISEPISEPISEQIEYKYNIIQIEKETLYESDQFESNFYSEKEFLEDWKIQRLEFDKMPTNILKLDFHEKNYFIEILKNYERDKINNGIIGLFQQKNMYTANRLRPKHFLENFEKYLDCFVNKQQLFEQNNKNGSTTNETVQRKKSDYF